MEEIVPKIYLVGGKARNGKSTLAHMIKAECEKRGQRTALTSYGRYIKDYAKNFFGWDGSEETKPRDLLQYLGTEIIRGKLHMNDFFVKRMIDDIKILSFFFDTIVIDDARLEIEIDKLWETYEDFVPIKIIRDNFDNGLTERQKKDITEIDLDDYDRFKYVVHNDGTIDDLQEKVVSIVDKEDNNEKND